MITIDDYVIDVLMRDLVGHDRRVVSFLVYLWFTREQGKEQEKEQGKEQRKGNVVEASYRQIAECIGVSKARSRPQSAGSSSESCWLRPRKPSRRPRGTKC